MNYKLSLRNKIQISKQMLLNTASAIILSNIKYAPSLRYYNEIPKWKEVIVNKRAK